MLEFIKNIFTKDASTSGELFIQNTSRGTGTAAVVNDTLQITLSGKNSSNEKIKIAIKDIKNLEDEEDAIAFSCRDKKYRFVGKDTAVLFGKIHPLVFSSYIFESTRVTYYIYNTVTRLFEPHDQKATLRVYEDIFYYLRIEDESSILHFEEINTSTQYYIDLPNQSFVWSIFSNDHFYTFCMKFDDNSEFLEFRSKYIECCYKSVNKDMDSHAIFSGIAEYTSASGDTASDEGSEEDWSEWRGEASKPSEFSTGAQSNEHLVMGDSQFFVSRGSALGVFDLADDGPNFRTQIKNVLSDPMKIITHGGNTSLVVLDKQDRSHLSLMDLAKGEVVEKWDVENKLNDCFDSLKYSNDGTLVGLSDYSLFRIDPRVKEKIVEKKEYKTKNEFSCGMATGSGGVAVASRKGDLRLYDKIDKRAKTLLPGFGDEVRGIDTSKDGSVILCTCKSYILVFQVNPNYSKNSKQSPTPRRLQLKPQHLGFIKDEIAFSTAKFDQNDTVIISSTGRFIVKWKVEDVLAGNIYSYSLKALSESVVDENFIVNGSDIVVALKNDVKKVDEKDLKRPNF